MQKWADIYKRFEKLPYQAQQMAYIGGMFTGGVVSYLIGSDSIYKDIDIVVTANNWRNIGEFIKKEFTNVALNKFGGLRIEHPEADYDIWPIDLLEYLGSEGKHGKQLWVLDMPAKKLYHSVNLNV